ncbi:hypothetical protein HMPREF9418_0935 [Neisseria macacae ATCC 33926]|uniref:Uncharacterized protein n=2 Tax=Neisseria TaxID=482 RepID=I2NV86_NEISI|nr:hypothetical protein HMPREF9418_0935 [Neisseria macacae ATCC 33926]EIG29747.1 hypothetical protein HMPREF1051_0930 [Neisseria sicca VK64]
MWDDGCEVCYFVKIAFSDDPIGDDSRQDKVQRSRPMKVIHPISFHFFN